MLSRMLFFGFLSCISFSSCQQESPSFTIIGEIEGIPDSSLITLYDIDQQFNLDSAYSKNGKFEMSGRVSNPSNCWLRYKQEYSNILVENEKITFQATLPKMHLSSTIKGGPEQELFNQAKELMLPHDQQTALLYDSLSLGLYKSEIHKQKLIMDLNQSQRKSQAIYIDFGKAHPNSFFGMDILYRNRLYIGKDSLTKIYAKINPSYRNTDIGNAISTFLTEDLAQVGNPVPSLEAFDLDGTKFNLKELKGKFIYLTFWSTYCIYCQKQNISLNDQLNELPEEVSLVHFSIDQQMADWKKGSQRDAISWYNISDLKGPKGKIKTQFQVQGTPASFLIDPSGKLIKNYGGFDPNLDLMASLREEITTWKNQ